MPATEEVRMVSISAERQPRVINGEENEQLDVHEDDSPLSSMLETFKFDDLDQNGA